MEQELTFGEKAVGLTFNPSGDVRVIRAKKLYAEIIDMMDELIFTTDSGSASNYAKQAITEAQTAQMWAVKALTWKD